MKVLDSQIVEQRGQLVRRRTWVRGAQLGGTITVGLTGIETIQERDAVRPTRTFFVHEFRKNAS